MTISPVTNVDVPSDPRPAIAIVANSQTPYRLHVHRRIAAEIPEVQLFSLYTHQSSNSDWAFDAPAEIGPVLFGEGESSGDQDRLARLPREWRRGGRIIRWLRAHRVRFVVMMGYNDAGRLRIMRWCRRAGVPCYLFGDSNVHGDRTAGLKSFIKRRFLRHVLRWCDGVLVCGTLGQRYFARYGVPAEQTFFFPYEPDYNLIEQLPARAVSDARERFNLPAGRRRIVYSGRLVDVKRVDLLIDAFVAIANERTDWDLVILGSGPRQAALASRVPANLAGRVRWLGFVGDQAGVSAVYRTCCVLVLPSDYEPWALVVNEAVAAGLVVVSSDVVGAAAELVVDRVNGRLFPRGDLPQLTACLLDVTTAGTTERLGASAPAVLADWRRRADPVAGLRSALARAGVLSPHQAGRANAEPLLEPAPG